MNRAADGRRTLGRLLVSLLLVGLPSAPASGQDEKGARFVTHFDLTPSVASAAAVARTVTDAYQTVLVLAMRDGSVNAGCLAFQGMGSRFSKEAARPINDSFSGGMFDYAVWGELTGSEGAYTAVIRIGTASTRKIVATEQVSFAAASDAARAGTELGNKLLQSKGGLGEAIAAFERDRSRAEGSGYAMAPALAFEVVQHDMPAGSSQDVTVRLTDCDDEPLKRRKVQLQAEVGSVSTREATTDDDGVAKFRYKAPSKRGMDGLTARFEYAKPSDAPGAEPAVDIAGLTITREPPQGPPVWHVELELNQVADLDFKAPATDASLSMSITANGDINPMKLAFDIDRDRQPLRDTLEAQYTWRSRQDVSWSTMKVYSQAGNETDTKLVDWSFSLTRHVKPADGVKEIEACDDDTEQQLAGVFGGGAGQPNDTAIVKFDTTIRGMVTEVDNVSQTTSRQETLPTYGEERTVKYRYDQRVNEDTLRLPLASSGMVRWKTNTLRYVLTFKPTLRFDAVAVPTIEVDGEDFTDRFPVKAYFREWSVPIDAGVIGYPAKGKYTRRSNWQEDPDFRKDFYTRAMAMVGATPSTHGDFPAERVLREYLIVVDKLPELGFHYYLLACTTAPPGQHYEINRYAVKKITADQWKQIKDGTAPWQTERTAGTPANSARK